MIEWKDFSPITHGGVKHWTYAETPFGNPKFECQGINRFKILDGVPWLAYGTVFKTREEAISYVENELKKKCLECLELIA